MRVEPYVMLAYLLLALCALGLARAVVGLRGMAQLLLGLQQLRAQAAHVRAVRVHLRQRARQLSGLPAGLLCQCVQRRTQRARSRLYAGGAHGLRRHAVRPEVYLYKQSSLPLTNKMKGRNTYAAPETQRLINISIILTDS